MRFLMLLICFVFVGAAVALAADEKRVALVVGNGGYTQVPFLDNPTNDATDLAAALGRVGFDVTLLLDADDRDLRRGLRDFARVAATADVSLVYFAGHGIEVDKVNYLLPVNTQLMSGLDIEYEAIPLDLIMRSLAQSKGIKIVLIDACRDNPFAERLITDGSTRSIGIGLGRVDPVGGVLPGGILLGYAAREGTVALDGVGRNSPYAQALLEFIEEPGLELSKMMRKVRDRVFELTDGQQEPFTYGSLPGDDIYFIPPVVQAALPATPAAPAPDTGHAEFVAAFAKAQEFDTLTWWADFLRDHADRADDPLMQIAMKRHAELQAERDKREAERKRAPWLTPQAGWNGYQEPEFTRNERVLIQTALLYMGFDPGPPDGAFGSKTRSAISAARNTAGLSRGSQVDRALAKVLPNVPAIDALKSDKARNYKDADTSDLLEPRLIRAFEVFKYSEINFDYFRGHLYIAVISRNDWQFANTRAHELGGHLVTIGTAAENRFVHDLFLGDPRFYTVDADGYTHGPHIGLYQVNLDREPRGGWAWVTGEPMTYSNWSPGNPDNHKGNQHFGAFYRKAKDRHRLPGPIKWDDTTGRGRSAVFEIE
ncbi:MAG: caspase family protein [Paracoccaceae bacterium]